MINMNRNSLDTLMTSLLVIGGLNWGLVGLFDINLVEALFGAETLMTNIIYALVGLSALYVAIRALMIPTDRGTIRTAYR